MGGGDSCRQLGFIVNYRALTFSENNPAAQSAASQEVSTPLLQALLLLRRLSEIEHVLVTEERGREIKAPGV